MHIIKEKTIFKLVIAFFVLWKTNLIACKLHQQYQSYQKLSIVYGNIMSITFMLTSQKIPLLLQNFIHDFELEQLRVKMGSRFRHDLHGELPHNGILTQIINGENTEKLQQKLPEMVKIIAGIFYLSINQQFVIPLRLVDKKQQIFINNPNDKFCSQQLQSIITTFLPCKSFAGLGSLLSSKILFTGKYVGAQIIWRKQSLLISFYVEKTNDLLNLANSKLSVCQMFDVTQASNWMNKTVSVGKPLIKQMTQSLAQFQRIELTPQTLRDISLYSIKNANPARYVRGKWYSYAQQKQLLHFYKIFRIEQLKKIDYVIFQELFPKGFQVLSTECIFETQNNSRIKIATEIEIQSRTEKTTLVRAKAFTNFTDQFQVKIEKQKQGHLGCFRLIIKYRPLIRSFTEYEVIAGGGEEFMRLPLLIFKDGQTIVQANQVLEISDKIMEPDFSIPFHVMTFSSALFGYIWVSIWRLFLTKKNVFENKKSLTDHLT